MEAIGAAATMISLMALGVQISKFVRSCAQGPDQVKSGFGSLKREISLLSSTLASMDKSCEALSLQSRSVQDLCRDLAHSIRECQSSLRSIALEADRVLRGTAHWPFNKMGVAEGLQTLRAHREHLEAHFWSIILLQNQVILYIP
jgi:hypothetical protein